MDKSQPPTFEKFPLILLSLLILCGLYLTSRYSYLLFHSLAELFSIVIAFAMFIIAWNSRRFGENDYLLFIGTAYLFVGGFDLIHTLGYKGMGVFHGYDTNFPTQLWIAARYLESLSLLIVPFLIGRKLKIGHIFVIYSVIFMVVLSSIFGFVFPDCFIEGSGLTPFKKMSEYVISLFLFASIFVFHRKQRELNPQLLRLLIGSIVVTIVSELSFTLYIDAYGFFNLIGHFLKIVSFYLIYKALIETALMKPYDVLFRNLTHTNAQLQGEINERKQAEEAILVAQRELKDKNTQLQELNAGKDKFFSIIAHDLRGPLNSLKVLTQVTEDQFDSYSPDKLKEVVALQHTSIDNLCNLLENLLTWSRIQRGMIEYQPQQTDVKGVIERNIALLTSNAEQKQITLRSSIPEKVFAYADPNMVDTIVRNLLSNALKFTGPSGTVDVSTTQDEAHVNVSVSDTGMGIDEKTLPKLFRIDTVYHKRGTAGEKGTGLGLILCKEFVEKNEGKIGVKSEVGKGSTFTFTLPKKHSNTFYHKCT